MNPDCDKNYLLIIYVMSCKYKEDQLPFDMFELIQKKCLKIIRQNTAIKMFGKGKSRSSAKRRGEKYERCFKCGNWLHNGVACSKNQTNSQYEFERLMKDGPFQCMEDNSLNRRGFAHRKMRTEMRRLKERGTRIGIDL